MNIISTWWFLRKYEEDISYLNSRLDNYVLEDSYFRAVHLETLQNEIGDSPMMASMIARFDFQLMKRHKQNCESVCRRRIKDILMINGPAHRATSTYLRKYGINKEVLKQAFYDFYRSYEFPGEYSLKTYENCLKGIWYFEMFTGEKADLFRDEVILYCGRFVQLGCENKVVLDDTKDPENREDVKDAAHVWLTAIGYNTEELQMSYLRAIVGHPELRPLNEILGFGDQY